MPFFLSSYQPNQEHPTEDTGNEKLLGVTIVTRNGKIVWKHGPNLPFYALMLRTMQY